MSHTVFEQDYITAYETALAALKVSPESLQLKHQAVLALARSGALEFAEAEFHRFGLADVNDDEDIMALAGRLAKDSALSQKGAAQAEEALRSANLYRTAFEVSEGFYSGMNAATMQFVADRDKENAAKAAQNVLELLPEARNLMADELYFIEATRAEAFLLQERRADAETALRRAVQHDPMNFTAHASTLKQFRMIEHFMGADAPWLDPFAPPAAAHYCGHMFGVEGGARALSKDAEAELKIRLSDLIQRKDIGFGFGALAAGADIVFAETLLEEGGELNVYLPIDEARFKAVSVAPYGDEMLARYDACLSSAKTVSILSPNAYWPDNSANALNARVAMGQSVMRAAHLSTRAEQIAVFDEKAPNSQTAMHMNDWRSAGRVSQIVPLEYTRARQSDRAPAPSQDYVVVMRSDTGTPEVYGSAVLAIEAAIEVFKRSDHTLQIAIAAGLATETEKLQKTAGAMCETGFDGVIRANSVFASLIALEASDQYQVTYQGRCDLGDLGEDRIFAVRGRAT